jgi:regulator of protease activity HflC (stomatin/prohibitin superfamily)
MAGDEELIGFVKKAAKVAGVLAVVAIPLYMVGCPVYSVWAQGKEGEAQLKHAESSKQIAIQEAHAKMESAKLLAQAEVERSRGVAEANKIIGDSLKGNDAYLRYLWIQGLGQGAHETIYVPTEAGLPILEANRLQHQPEK